VKAPCQKKGGEKNEKKRHRRGAINYPLVVLAPVREIRGGKRRGRKRNSLDRPFKLSSLKL